MYSTEVKPATKTVHTPLEVTAEVTPRLFFGRSGTVHTKYSLQMTSAVAPKGVCTVLVADFRRIPVAYSDFSQSPQMAKKCPKTGHPQKKHDF